MRRWLVKSTDGYEMKLYYKTLELAQERNKGCDIEELFDRSHEEYIHKIIELSTEKLYDYRGREVLKIPHNAGFIYVKVYLDKEDNTYYDYMEFQRHDTQSLMNPIGFVTTAPLEFYDNFIKDRDKDKTCGRLSSRDVKKIKAKRFYNKNNYAYWVDDDGYIYWAEKYDLPNKKNKEEWNRFKGNKEAVFINYTEPVGCGNYYEWFDSMESFINKFQNIIDNTPSSHAKPEYRVVKTGYTYINPEDRKNIFRLPFLDIVKEIDLLDSANEKSKYNSVARMWAKMLDDKRFYGEWFDNIDFLEDIVKRYMEYLTSVS